MPRGKLQPPNLDDRTWQQIVDQAKLLRNEYTKEWTDEGPSDLGITLIELFAWMSEQIIYRLNKVPEKSLLTYLDLVGIHRDPPTPASTLITLQASQDVLVERVQASTPATENQTPIVFENDEPFMVYAGGLTSVAIAKDDAFHDRTDEFNELPLQGVNLTFLSENEGRFQTLALGFDGPTDLPDELILFLGGQSTAPDVTTTTHNEGTVSYRHTGGTQPRILELSGAQWPKLELENDRVAISIELKNEVYEIEKRVSNQKIILAPDPKLASVSIVNGPYKLVVRSLVPATSLVVQASVVTGFSSGLPTVAPFEHVFDGTNAFREPGTIKLVNPPSWARVKLPITNRDGDVGEEDKHWVFLQLENVSGINLQLHLQYLLFNTTRATNAITLAASEALSTKGTGEPLQIIDLRESQLPVYRDSHARDPFHHFVVEVQEEPSAETETWQRFDELPPGDTRGYVLDPVRGRVIFGNYDDVTNPTGHGRIPPEDSDVTVASYRHGADGALGNVSAGALSQLALHPSGISGVNNYVRASGGSDEEPVEETIRRGPTALRNRFRAVTVDDYEYLAAEASTDVNKVRCLENTILEPLVDSGVVTKEGYVTVLIVPNATLSELTPNPSADLIIEVASYLHKRRPLGIVMHVDGPQFAPINVGGIIKLFERRDMDEFVEEFQRDLDSRLKRFLHPTLGGPSGTGWQIGESIGVHQVVQFLDLDPAIGFISELSLSTADGTPQQRIEIADHQILTAGSQNIALEESGS